jgi:hypothetical protein
VSGPVGRALARSALRHAIEPGMQAVRSVDAPCIATPLRSAFKDSLDLDTATRQAHKDDHRWDYLLGHTATGHVVALEVHPAETSEVTRVIAKRDASQKHMNLHLEPGAHIAAWYWAASAAPRSSRSRRTNGDCRSRTSSSSAAGSKPSTWLP